MLGAPGDGVRVPERVGVTDGEPGSEVTCIGYTSARTIGHENMH